MSGDEKLKARIRSRLYLNRKPLTRLIIDSEMIRGVYRRIVRVAEISPIGGMDIVALHDRFPNNSTYVRAMAIFRLLDSYRSNNITMYANTAITYKAKCADSRYKWTRCVI
jgi:hypothetical protein